MKSVLLIVLLGIFIYFGAIIYLYVTQDSKIFNRKWATPYEPHTAKKTYFKTSDGTVLEGAFTQNGENLPLVLYFSGNANNAIRFLDNIAPKIKEYNFVGFNYPGYANSQGEPSEKKILKYAREIYSKYKPDIIVGRSLGTAVAVYTAKAGIKKLVLITPFDSITNVAKHKYPFLPVQKLIKYPFEEYKWIKDVKCKVNVLLVKNDETIPKTSTENLLKNIPNPGVVITLDGVKHSNVYEHKDIVKTLKKLLSQ